jgi:hypothetical protein
MSPLIHSTAASALIVALLAPAVSAQTPTSSFVPLTAESVTVEALRTPITASFANATIADAITNIARQAGVSLTYDATLPGLDLRVSIAFARTAASRAILRVLEDTPLRAMVSSSGQLVLLARPAVRHAGVLGGTLRDATTATPLGGARVELVGTRFATLSRDDGRFSLGVVPFGAYAARITRMGFRPVLIDSLRVATDVPPPIDVALDHASVSLSTVVVTPGYFGIMQPTLDAPQTLSREQIETVPQIAEDVYRAVNRLPGVSSSDFSADFAVRGGSGSELYATLDGLELIEPFHLKDMGGGLSIIDSRAIGGLELITGGFSSEYGDRLTGVFNMRTLDPTGEASRTSLGLSVMNARAMSQGAFNAGRGGWLVSARRGYIDLALRLANAADSLEPRYYDVFAKAQYDLGRAGRAAVHLLDAGDALTYLDTPDPSIRSHYRSSYGWLTWEGRVGARLRQQSVVSIGHLSWHREGERVERGRLTAAIDDRRALDVGAVRQDWSLDLTRRALVRFGADVRRGSASYDYLNRVFDETLMPDGTVTGSWDTTAIRTSPDGTRLGAYVAPRVRLARSLTTEVGLRYDRASYAGDAVLSPRVNVAWQPSAGTAVRAAWGRYVQSQGLSALQVQDGVSAFSPPERSEHRVLGVEQALPNGMTARVEAYDRRLSDERPRFVSVGPGVDVFPEIGWDRVAIAPSRGRARGLELLLARDLGGRTSSSLGYALASVTDRIGDRDVPRGMDQRHTITGDWAFRPASNRWRFSAAGVWHSGWPFTPPIVVIDTLANTPTTFSLRMTRKPGELYTERLPAYRRVDVRYTRFFDTRSGRVSLFAEVYNLLDIHNRRGYSTNVNVDRQRRITFSRGTEDWIPRLPTFGITYEFGGPHR